MTTTKELRGKNNLLNRLQRQHDEEYQKKLKEYNERESNRILGELGDLETLNLFQPTRTTTRAELGKKRSVLR